MDEIANLSTINDKYQQVLIWLDQIYGGENIPQFELNSRTVSILYDLVIENKQQEHNTQLIIEDLRQKASEYQADGKRVSRILSEIRLSSDSLSQSGMTSVCTLAKLALHLGVKDTSDSSYLLALQSLTEESAKVSEDIDKETHAVSDLTEKAKSTFFQYNSLLQTLNSVEERRRLEKPEIDNKQMKVKLYNDKAKDYKNRIEKFKIRLAKSGVDPSLYHQTLIKKSEELNVLKLKIAPLQVKLQSYHDLPPDLTQIKVKIEEMKQHVAELDMELCKKIDIMHL